MWQSERVLNALRAGMWLVMAGVAMALDVIYLGHITAVAFVSMAWGSACAALGATVLRRRYVPALMYVLVTVDFSVLAWGVGSLYPVLDAVDPAMAQGHLRMIGTGVLVVLATNVLRLSHGVALWSLACGSAAYVAVHLKYGEFDPSMVAELILFAAMTVLVMFAMTKTGIVVERIKERDALARFLPEPALERATGSGAIDLGGREVEATVLFADIRGFTSLSSERSPHDVVAMLNEYFAEMVDEIFSWRGVLDKFLGDGICAVFTTVVDQQEPAQRALACAAGMLARLRELNVRRAARGDPPLAIGIGLHTGSVLAGTIGSPLRMEYTHIGDVVNTAARIQDLTKRFRSPLIASAATVARAGGVDVAPGRDLGSVEIRGRAEPVHLVALDVAELTEPGDSPRPQRREGA